MGGGGSKQETNTNVVSSIVSESIAKTMQTCVSVSNINQGYIIIGNGNTFNNNVKKMAVTLNMKCMQDSSQITEIQNKIIDNIKQQAQQTNTSLANALNSLVGEKNRQETLTQIEQTVRNRIDNSVIQEIGTYINASNTTVFKGDNNTFSNNREELTLTSVSQAIQTVLMNNGIFNELDNKLDQGSKQETKNGLAEIIDALGKIVTSVTDSITSAISSMYTSGIMVFIVLIIAVTIVAIVFLKSGFNICSGPLQYLFPFCMLANIDRFNGFFITVGKPFCRFSKECKALEQ
jgi:hypothetical protein